MDVEKYSCSMEYDEMIFITPPHPIPDHIAEKILDQIKKVQTGEAVGVVFPGSGYKVKTVKVPRPEWVPQPKVSMEMVEMADMSAIIPPRPQANRVVLCEVCQSDNNVKFYEVGFLSNASPHFQCKMPEIQAILCEPCSQFPSGMQEYLLNHITVNFVPSNHPFNQRE